MNPVPGRGFGGRGAGPGLGRGGGRRGGGFGGRGWRHRYYATGLPGWMRCGMPAPVPGMPPAGQEKEMLRQQAEALRSEIDLINKRLSELEAAEAGE